MADPELRAEMVDEIARPRQSVVAALDALALGPGTRVLDVGCGAGPHLGLFAGRIAPGGAVVGLDSSAERLALAAELWADQLAAGTIALRAGDGCALPFDAATFDLAWSSAVLHHIERPGDFLAEQARVVRPGGHVAVLDADAAGSFPCIPWPPDLEHRARAAAWAALAADFDGALPYHFAGYVGRQLPRLLREAGLRAVRLHAVNDVDRAPLDPRREEGLRRWFVRWFEERLRDFLPPRDGRRFLALFDPASPDYLLASPDFFQVRTYYLAAGMVP
ncbi:MAG TPA: methyltransferase domain-containing protein [Thermomicrobiales bacterium]|nr:methyltransferase domain-containing protein [Thermomicrobiales bacterium]